MHFILKYFDDLSPSEVYDFLQLREDVFQIEQDCIYKDIDDKDQQCWHLMLFEKKELLAYARIVPEGISYGGYISIGRVVSKRKYRKKGYGRLLMKEAMQQMEQLFSGKPCKISAQAYLVNFYESFGFVTSGETYLEDNIPHIAMIKHQKL
jgi:ElaA protein